MEQFSLYSPILAGVFGLLGIGLAYALGRATRKVEFRRFVEREERPILTHAHKFFPWARMPSSEIADLERADRCCNIQSSDIFCIICYHAPNCTKLRHS